MSEMSFGPEYHDGHGQAFINTTGYGVNVAVFPDSPGRNSDEYLEAVAIEI